MGNCAEVNYRDWLRQANPNSCAVLPTAAKQVCARSGGSQTSKRIRYWPSTPPLTRSVLMRTILAPKSANASASRATRPG